MIHLLLAQTPAQSPGAQPGTGGLAAFLPFVFLILIFYFVIIRPQKRRVQQHAQLVRSIEIGDEVETAGGIYGRVQRLEDDALWVEIAPGTTVKISRAAIRNRLTERPSDGGNA